MRKLLKRLPVFLGESSHLSFILGEECGLVKLLKRVPMYSGESSHLSFILGEV